MGGGDVDDPSPTLLLHLRYRYRNTVERRRQIDSQNCIPLGNRELINRRGELDAGIVDEGVEAAEALECSGDECCAGICVTRCNDFVSTAQSLVGLVAPCGPL